MINTTHIKTTAGETLVTYRTAGSSLLIVSATVNGANVRDILTDSDVDAIETAMTNAAAAIAPAATAPVQPDPVQPDYSPSAEDIVAAARAFCAEIAAVIEANYRATCPAMVAAGVVESCAIEFGRKYAKLIRTALIHGETSSRSAFGFVDLATGDILKAASWAKPAAGARGNVLDIAGRRNSYTPYGINYLR